MQEGTGAVRACRGRPEPRLFSRTNRAYRLPDSERKKSDFRGEYRLLFADSRAAIRDPFRIREIIPAYFAAKCTARTCRRSCRDRVPGGTCENNILTLPNSINIFTELFQHINQCKLAKHLPSHLARRSLQDRYLCQWPIMRCVS